MSNSKDLDKKLAKLEAKAKTFIKWIAVDSDGRVCGFVNKPRISDIKARWNAFGQIAFLGETDDEDLRKNWDKTLRKVNYEQ